MANKAGSQAPFIIVFGGDAYLNKRTGRDLIRRALHDRPDAERIDLDARADEGIAFQSFTGHYLASARKLMRSQTKCFTSNFFRYA